MIIDVKYNVGDCIKFYKKNWTEKYVKCGCCNGEGSIIGYNGKRYDCGHCGGKGVIRDGYDVEEELKESIISSVHFQYDSDAIEKKKLKIWYKTPRESRILQEDIIEKVVSEQEMMGYSE